MIHLEGDDLKASYRCMCGKDNARKLSLIEMINRLTGLHHNALAWHTALAVCAKDDSTIVGSWMQMSEAFSSLPLDPKDQDAWHFWHLLSECTKDDESGRKLMSFLGETQNEMSQAFENIWPVVNTLESGLKRYTSAATISSTIVPSEGDPRIQNIDQDLYVVQ